MRIGLGLLALLHLFLIPSKAYCQPDLNRFTHATNSELPITTGFALANPKLNQVGVFLIDNRQIHAYGLNERLDVDRKIELIKQKRTYDQIVGNMVNEYGYTLFFNNKKEKSVTYLRFSFEQNGIDLKGDLPINLKTKKILAHFEYQDDLHILTVEKKEPVFYLYRIDKALKMQEHRIDGTYLELLGSSGRQVPVQQLLIHANAEISSINLSGNDYPIGLTESSANFKLYRQENLLYLTMDHQYEMTQMLILDLDDISLQSSTFDKPELEKRNTRPKSNSFLRGDQLAQIIQSSDSLKISMLNIKTGTRNEILALSRDDEESGFSFSQKKSWKEEEKQLSTSQYFRKLKFNPLGLSFIPDAEGYHLTFGSWNKSEESSGGSNAAAGMGAVFGGVVGALISYAIAEAVSPEFQSYSRFANGKTSYARLAVSQQFEVSNNGNPDLNLFERIDQYSKSQEKELPLLLFEFQDKTILGLWNPKYEVMSFHGF
ncbi:hypothetical protein [Aureitalea marina]|uniref:Uncharacterized protein n=1 Tax=Aureitalea marina TaxID=930804 RepID=A0A2S7KRN4_9FLAO|nr:hypothetical protein [Aureitalea marina]PQB05280.1 hypothetical protein BST85_10590 [Aureitalea marina]